MDRIFDVEARRRIFEIIQKHPGLHMREVSRRLDLLSSLVEYHLKALKKNELVYFIKEDGYKRYYISDDIPSGNSRRLTSRQREILNLLRQEVPVTVVMIVLDNPNAKHREILDAVDVSASTLSYHLKRLVDANILEKRSTGKKKGFRIVDRNEVLTVLITGGVKPPSPADGFIKTWEDFY